MTIGHSGAGGSYCTCSTNPNDIHAQCANWGCSMTVYSSPSVSSAVQPTLYRQFPIG